MANWVWPQEEVLVVHILEDLNPFWDWGSEIEGVFSLWPVSKRERIEIEIEMAKSFKAVGLWNGQIIRSSWFVTMVCEMAKSFKAVGLWPGAKLNGDLKF